MRRAASALALMVAFSVPDFRPALADHAPVYVVPAMRGVPVIINGQDASWAVVEGDWGLARPGHGSTTVIHGRPVLLRSLPGHYYPATGRTPWLGRYEIKPPADQPRRAETYSRSWTTQSQRVPASVTPQYDLRDLPPVTIEPRQSQRRPRPPVPCHPGLYC